MKCKVGKEPSERGMVIASAERGCARLKGVYQYSSLSFCLKNYSA